MTITGNNLVKISVKYITKKLVRKYVVANVIKNA